MSGKNKQLGTKGNNLGLNIHADFEKSGKTSTFHFPLCM